MKNKIALMTSAIAGLLLITSCSLASDIHTSINGAFGDNTENTNQVDLNTVVTTQDSRQNGYYRATPNTEPLTYFFNNVNEGLEKNAEKFLEDSRAEFELDLFSSPNQLYHYDGIDNCWFYIGNHPEVNITNDKNFTQALEKIVCGGSINGWYSRDITISGNTFKLGKNWEKFSEDFFKGVSTKEIMTARTPLDGSKINIDDMIARGPYGYLDAVDINYASGDPDTGLSCYFTNYKYICQKSANQFTITDMIEPLRTFVGHYQICQIAEYDKALYCKDLSSDDVTTPDTYDLYPNGAEKVETTEKINNLVFGNGIICGLNETGSLYCWGKQDFVKTSENEKTPVKVDDGDYRSISMDNNTLCAVDFDNNGFCWMTSDQKLTKIEIPIQDLKFVSSNGLTTCVVTSDDEIFCKGSSQNGLLGSDNSNDVNYWEKPYFTPPTGIEGLSMNTVSACVKDFNAVITCWGGHSYDWRDPQTLISG